MTLPEFLKVPETEEIVCREVSDSNTAVTVAEEDVSQEIKDNDNVFIVCFNKEYRSKFSVECKQRNYLLDESDPKKLQSLMERLEKFDYRFKECIVEMKMSWAETIPLPRKDFQKNKHIWMKFLETGVEKLLEL